MWPGTGWTPAGGPTARSLDFVRPHPGALAAADRLLAVVEGQRGRCVKPVLVRWFAPKSSACGASRESDGRGNRAGCTPASRPETNAPQTATAREAVPAHPW